MARARKNYTQTEINAMSEKRMQKLFDEGRISDDMWQRWYDNQEEIRVLTEQAKEEIATEVSDTTEVAETKAEGIDNPIDEEEEYEKYLDTFVRANRCTVEATESGYVVHFYRTHKHVEDIEVNTEGAHSNALREQARNFAIGQCPQYAIHWNPEKQVQAWERKYNTYMTDEEVTEDTLTLITPAIERLVEKCKYDMELIGIEVTAITPNKSNLSYIEKGRYTKSGAWCTATIEVTVHTHVVGEDMDILYNVEMKSGQICKPKTTIAEWNAMTIREMELNGIEVSEEKEVA